MYISVIAGLLSIGCVAWFRCIDNSAALNRVGQGPWVHLLTNVKSSTMAPDPRRHTTPWRWELELYPRAKGTAKPRRVRPLFSFLAVPSTRLGAASPSHALSP